MLHYVTVQYPADRQFAAIESAVAELLDGLRYHNVTLDEDRSIEIHVYADGEVTAEVVEK